MTGTVERPHVDVVIPVLDRERTIGLAIESVLAQTFTDIDLIVVDDGSTDGTIDVVSSIDDHRLTVVARQHGGPAAARNAGAGVGRGSHLAFVDSDDVVQPFWLESLLDLSTSAGIVSCGGRIIRAGQEPLHRTPSTLGPEFYGCTAIFLPGFFVARRDVYERAGGYDERMRFSENTELAFRLTEAAHEIGAAMLHTDEPLIDVHQPQDRASRSSDHQRIRDAAELILDKHGERLAAAPRHLASYHAIAGVNSLKLGESRRAREHLRSAAKGAPSSLRYRLRLAQTYLPARMYGRAGSGP